MIELYWICFAGGAIAAVLLVLADNVLGGWIDGVLDFLPDFINPISVIAGIVAFGGAGILFTAYSPLHAWAIFTLSVLAALLISILLFYFYVKPMRKAENSISYSITELPGKIGRVTIPIPENGYGEVAFTFGHGFIYEIANSTDKMEILAGERVLAIDVKDSVVTVCRWTESSFST